MKHTGDVQAAPFSVPLMSKGAAEPGCRGAGVVGFGALGAPGCCGPLTWVGGGVGAWEWVWFQR